MAASCQVSKAVVDNGMSCISTSETTPDKVGASTTLTVRANSVLDTGSQKLMICGVINCLTCPFSILWPQSCLLAFIPISKTDVFGSAAGAGAQLISTGAGVVVAGGSLVYDLPA